jgi:hypothetical protein
MAKYVTTNLVKIPKSWQACSPDPQTGMPDFNTLTISPPMDFPLSEDELPPWDSHDFSETERYLCFEFESDAEAVQFRLTHSDFFGNNKIKYF